MLVINFNILITESIELKFYRYDLRRSEIIKYLLSVLTDEQKVGHDYKYCRLDALVKFSVQNTGMKQKSD